MDDICKQLAAAVGEDVQQVRKTAEVPPRVSVIDVLTAITGHDRNVAASDLRRLVAKYPDLRDKVDFEYQFQGARQRKTPVAGVGAIVEIVMFVTGPCAARLRQEVAELMVRYWGGRPSHHRRGVPATWFARALASPRAKRCSMRISPSCPSHDWPQWRDV